MAPSHLDNAAKVDYSFDDHVVAYRKLVAASILVERVEGVPFPRPPPFDASAEDQEAWYENLTEEQAIKLAMAIRHLDERAKENEES